MKRFPGLSLLVLPFALFADETSEEKAIEPRPFVHTWKVGDFDDVISVGLESNRDFGNAKKMFAVADCADCHQLNATGSSRGPDLDSVSRKFSPRDLLETIIEPDREIPDGYAQTRFEMKDGTVVTGIPVNSGDGVILVSTDLKNPDVLVRIETRSLESMRDSEKSMMPVGLLDTLSKDDVLDLIAYLLAKADPAHPMFAE